jgi:hypothetical protein
MFQSTFIDKNSLKYCIVFYVVADHTGKIQLR